MLTSPLENASEQPIPQRTGQCTPLINAIRESLCHHLWMGAQQTASNDEEALYMAELALDAKERPRKKRNPSNEEGQRAPLPYPLSLVEKETE